MHKNHNKEITTVIGLGNPGHRYSNTRHNAGFMVVDALVEKYHGTWQERNNMAIASLVINNTTITVIKPLTSMNLSGAIFPFLQKKGIGAENILVIHDELEKPFGTITVKEGGSHKGHNGIRSVIEKIGPDFLRLRIGIGRPLAKEEVPAYVVAPFQESPSAIAAMIDQAVTIVEDIISKSPAMR